MRVVVDTNVLVSGLLSPHGPPGRILDAVLSQKVVVLYDDRILDEYRAVLLRPIFGFGEADVGALLDFVEFTGEQILAQPLRVLLPDPSDLPFLEIAAAGDADCLITGNIRHYRPQRGHHSVNVCSPAEFVRRIGQ